MDGALLQGEPYDSAWRWFVNNHLSQGLLNLAVLWRLEGHPDYPSRIADVLRGYAARYEGYRLVPHTSPTPGVATHQSLDESVWILPLAWAFDLVRETLSPEQNETISQGLLIPVAEFLIENHYGGIHNFACWHNAAIATVGLVTGRQDLVEFAVTGEWGLDTQLREGVLSDGLWFEGSFSYHFYTLAAVIMQLKATRNLPEFDRRTHPTVQAMFDAPVRCAFPDGTLPATNDCWYFTGLIDLACHGVPHAPAFYEIACNWYQDERYAQVLQRAYRHGPRNSLDALLFGPEAIAETDIRPQTSDHLTGSGYAILRSVAAETPAQDVAANQSYIFLKYGPHGGGHGHPDKLNLNLFAHNCRLSVDLGTPGYGLDLFQSWYRRTISHNTMIVDGHSQPPAQGHINQFRADGDFQVADASVSWADGDYAGVVMRRVVLARNDYFLDVCIVRCDRLRRIDWIYHNLGDLHTSFDSSRYTTTAEDGAGYEHLSAVQRSRIRDDLTLNWSAGGPGLTLFTAGSDDDATVLTAGAPGFPPTELRHVVLNQRTAAQTAFLSVFHPHRGQPAVTGVRWLGRRLLADGWAGCDVQTDQGTERWTIQMSAQMPSQESQKEPVTDIDAMERLSYILNM